MEKSLGNTDINGARKNVKDIVVFGNGDMFQLLCKASSQDEGWMKSTKAMEVGHGCVVQVTTQQKNNDGTYSIAEALTYVPGVEITEDTEHGGRKLTAITRRNIGDRISFQSLLDETDKQAREALGEYYIVSKSPMDNYINCLESGAQRIKSLEEENLKLRTKINKLMTKICNFN